MAKQDIAKLSEIFTSNILNQAMLAPLSEKLGVSIESLVKLGAGVNPLNGSYTFPERDGQGNIIGILQRFPDGNKLMVTGSKRGLYYSVDRIGDNYVSGKHNWTRVSKELPCPICKKSDGCMLPRGQELRPPAVVCVHIAEGAVKNLTLGYLHIIDSKRNIVKTNLLQASNLPVILVEGMSDTASAVDLGFVAVGRSSAEGKIGFLPDLLRGRDVIIVGDNDAGAGKRGMEATFIQLQPVCKNIIKVLPPAQFKDLRQWKNQINLSQVEFLEWVKEHGDSGGNPDILPSDIAHDIAKMWLERERLQSGLPTIRCYKSQWIEYKEGTYTECDTESFRGSVYHFLEGKSYPKTDSKGEISLIPYKPTRAKVSDIIDALTDWCTIIEDPPIWLTDTRQPQPENLIAFQNGILDVNEYVNGRIKFYDPTPAFFSFNILPYKFDEDAYSQLWDNFLKDIFNHDKIKIKLLSQWFGYNCVPDMSMEKLLFCTGRPRSGKGTVLNTLASLLGYKQVVSTSFQHLCTQFGYQPLVGKLAVLLSDAKVPKPSEAEAALEKILQIVGRDPVGIRRMYLSYLPQVYLRCRFTIAMNDLPYIPDHVNALEPKLNILFFENSYRGKEDTSLKYRLQQEANQGKLINFALTGLKSLRQEGKFIEPTSSKILINQLRELTTPVSAFLLDCCELEPPGEKEPYYVIIDQLYDVWVKWCAERGRRPGIKEQFGRWFLAACPKAKPSRIRLNGRRYRIYEQVRLANWTIKDYLGVYK